MHGLFQTGRKDDRVFRKKKGAWGGEKTQMAPSEKKKRFTREGKKSTMPGNHEGKGSYRFRNMKKKKETITLGKRRGRRIVCSGKKLPR